MSTQRFTPEFKAEAVRQVIEGQRGLDPVWVFPYGMPNRNGKATPVHRMNDSAWKKARIRAAKKYQERFRGTEGIRLDPHPRPEAHLREKASGSWRHRGRPTALLGHKNGSITSHYSAAELGKLIDEANKISATDSRGPALTILRRKAG